MKAHLHREPNAVPDMGWQKAVLGLVTVAVLPVHEAGPGLTVFTAMRGLREAGLAGGAGQRLLLALWGGVVRHILEGALQLPLPCGSVRGIRKPAIRGMRVRSLSNGWAGVAAIGLRRGGGGAVFEPPSRPPKDVLEERRGGGLEPWLLRTLGFPCCLFQAHTRAFFCCKNVSTLGSDDHHVSAR